MATEIAYMRKRVLFVCMGNCVRSQMAEALARHLAADVILAESAGIHPLGFIDPTTLEVLKEEGISCDGQYSKGLRNSHVETPDLIVNMSGLPGKGLFHGKVYEDWQVQDPFGESEETHRRIFSEIRDRVKLLAERFRAALAEA
ncbi:MAG TPA: low molecular weight phosphatase family protein [Candidatus Acidoferrum sp.]|nr:low molecular weight phosphatase family protein [Candidatus Acidoferrum sp.]